MTDIFPFAQAQATSPLPSPSIYTKYHTQHQHRLEPSCNGTTMLTCLTDIDVSTCPNLYLRYDVMYEMNKGSFARRFDEFCGYNSDALQRLEGDSKQQNFSTLLLLSVLNEKLKISWNIRMLPCYST